MDRPIGVFDSGVGGLSVLREIRRLLPHEDVVYVADSGHAPYGDQPKEFIERRAVAILNFFLEQPAKAVVCFEGAAGPLLGQNNTPNPMPKLKDVPVMYLTAENSGRTNGPAIVAALNQSGARAEHINLKDRGITGNGHFAMVETNRREVFEVIRGWIESKFPAAPSARQTARR